MPPKIGNKNFDDAAQATELTYQNSIATATTRAQARTADIARYTAIVSSGLTNGIGVDNARAALRELLGPSAA